MINAVIFDMDGLLVDSERVTFETLGELSKENGYIMTKDIYIQLLGITNEKAGVLLKEIYGEGFDYQQYFGRLHDEMVKRYDKEGVPVKKGAFELLDQLKKDGKKCIVASSSNAEWVKTTLTRAGLIDKFDGTICGDEVKNAKPDPEIFLSACQKLGAEKEEAIILEDSYNGVLAANNAGIKVLCVPDMVRPDENKLKIHAFFNDLNEVKTYLEENNYEI
ncbi:MAG: HAD family phosphatase [Clostridia bacterium]|nr:HAD family phosphatase [Clostridia bacterium]